MVNMRKCAIIGCGLVGSTLAYTLTEGGLFSEMVLLDIDSQKAEGEAMDIGQSLPFLTPMRIYRGEYRDLADAGLIFLCAGVGQRTGETRLGLLSRNLRVFEEIIGSITAVNTEAILLVITNPVDMLTWYTLKISGYPAERVIGSGTVLDTARLKKMLSDDLGVDSRNVHTFIIGEHGDSELPVLSSSNISGVDLPAFYRACGRAYDPDHLFQMFENVRDSAYRIIESKGATYYAIARAVARIAQSLLRDEKSVLTVSTFARGAYGLDDICLGLPAVIGRGGVERVLEIPLSDEERRRLCESAQVLRGEYDSLLAAYS